ncbi:DMT family transporter [Micromonospora sp. WMMD882]|uniref:DMT family transporter n=1 Tax=Micromonospora sp. WMMD882 TaxID=3015151 RepID=UPI00248BF57A|nr:DMT family transporter [Micromonospora sp. WMMD882]WBB78771.1 DMT family transporter [Micromonospora sp. WMMD882]
MIPRLTPDKPALRSWLPGFVLLAAIWGSSFLFIKIGVRELHPLYVTLGRAATGAATLLVVLAVLRDRLPRDPRLWLHLSVVAAFGVAVPFTLFGYGEERIPSLLAGIWNATTPLVALPMAVLVFRTERLTVRRAVGLGLGFVGVLVVLGVWQGLGGATFTGQLLCFGAAACYGFSIPYQKRFVAGRAESGLSLSAAQLLIATAQLAVVAPLIAGAPPAPTGLSVDVLASVLALGAFGTGLAFVINLRNIRKIGASAASTVTYLIPVFAVLVGAVVLGETLTWHQPVGASIVLLGVAVSQGFPRRRRPGVRDAGPSAAPPTPDPTRRPPATGARVEQPARPGR